MGGFATASDDILRNILFRLPASSFASAACVNNSWNKVCDTVLACPKLATALSLNPSLPDAVKDVLDKVLSDPILPQFAIASIGLQFSLEAAHQLITQKLGSKVSVVTSTACRIIGRDVITHRMKEGPGITMVSKFLMDIKNYTASVSGLVPPEGMIVFGDQRVDLNPILAEIDCVMPEETVIVGDACSRLICKTGHNSQAYDSDL
ncbi:hypothetical protein V6N13_074367 [Hibiscus sabdariffa]